MLGSEQTFSLMKKEIQRKNPSFMANTLRRDALLLRQVLNDSTMEENALTLSNAKRGFVMIILKLAKGGSKESHATITFNATET